MFTRVSSCFFPFAGNILKTPQIYSDAPQRGHGPSCCSRQTKPSRDEHPNSKLLNHDATQNHRDAAGQRDEAWNIVFSTLFQ